MFVAVHHQLKYDRHNSDNASPIKEGHQPTTSKSAAEYVLCLRQGHHISQAGVDRVIKHTDLLLQNTLSAVQMRIQNITLNCNLSEIFESERLCFENVATNALQRKEFSHSLVY